MMRTIQKKCGKLEKNKKQLEQEVVNLRSHMEKNMVEHSQAQQYAREVEERARQDLVEKLKQVNLFLQVSLFPWPLWFSHSKGEMECVCVGGGGLHSVLCLLKS